LDIDIEPGTQPGEAISIDDKGMPRLRTDGHGKLYAHVDVVVPTNLDKKTKEMLEQIRDKREEATKVHSADENDGEGFFDRLRDRFRRENLAHHVFADFLTPRPHRRKPRRRPNTDRCGRASRRNRQNACAGRASAFSTCLRYAF